VDESVGVDHGAHEASQQRLGGKDVGVFGDGVGVVPPPLQVCPHWVLK